MAEEVKFGEDLKQAPKKTQRGIILYPPKDGGSVTVRFLGSQQKIYQEWDRSQRIFHCYHSKQNDNCILRVVSFVIDRTDEKVKAFLCPVSAFSLLGEYSPNHDFIISRKGTGLSTRYSVSSLGETEVDEDILERIKITSKVYPITDIFVKDLKWELLNGEDAPIENRFEILDL